MPLDGDYVVGVRDGSTRRFARARENADFAGPIKKGLMATCEAIHGLYEGAGRGGGYASRVCACAREGVFQHYLST